MSPGAIRAAAIRPVGDRHVANLPVAFPGRGDGQVGEAAKSSPAHESGPAR